MSHPRSDHGAVAPITYGPRFWIGVLLGWSVMAFGIHSAFRTFQASKPVYSVITLVLFALANDLIIAPAVIIIGLALRRVVRPGPVTATAVGVGVISVVVIAFTWPEIRHYGKDPALASSLQTGNYASGMMTVLGVVWGVAAIIVLARMLMRRRSSRPPRVATPSGPPGG